MEQTYPGIDDAKMHFNYLLNAFSDSRYIIIDDKPLLMIFDPVSVPEFYIEYFKQWTINAGFKGLYLVGNITHPSVSKDSLLKKVLMLLHFRD